MPRSAARATIDEPSGVGSASDESAAARSSCTTSTPGIGTNSLARRLPYVIVPVLSSSSVVTSPAASTARPDIASTLRCTSRSMPAMPMAESSAPIVVGMRQTSRATSTGMLAGAAAYDAIGFSVSTTTTKMIERLASRMFSAISFGVFWREAPSTSAIMRSTKVSPGFDVMRTTMRSESTRVPPVTAERSPPDSRTTGADSPVIADSSTEAMPWMMSPSPGIDSPADTTTMSPSRRSAEETSLIAVRSAAASDDLVVRASTRCATVEVRVCAQRVGLRLAAALGHGLGEVREDHGEPEPDRDAPR